MEGIVLDVKFDPQTFKAFSKNEGYMVMKVSGTAGAIYWCEGDITVKSPLSLAHDKELAAGHTRIGIFKGEPIEKKIKIYTRPNNYPETYQVAITLFLYGEDGAIAGRMEQKFGIDCKDVRDGKNI